VLQQEVFSERHLACPGSIRLDPGGLDSVGMTHRPEGVLTPDAACGETIPSVAFCSEAHNCSNNWVGCLYQSLSDEPEWLVARSTRLCFSKLNTPELAQLPPAYLQEALCGGYDSLRPIDESLKV